MHPDPQHHFRRLAARRNAGNDVAGAEPFDVAMLRLDAKGFSIVAHVHDEAIIEVLKQMVEKTLPVFRQLMMASPDWADGLPVVAKAWSAARYVK